MSEQDKLMKQLRELERYKAPENLQAKLMAIPQEQPKLSGFAQRLKTIAPIGLAAAAAILFFSSLPKEQTELPKEGYSFSEIENAKQELALALHYLNGVSQQTENSVNNLVMDSSKQAIYRGMFYPVLEGTANDQAETNVNTGETK